LGDAVLTGAGTLPFRGIIHVAAINGWWRASEYSIRRGTRNAMAIVNEHGFASVAFPLLGSGSGSFNRERSMQLMQDELEKIDSARVSSGLLSRLIFMRASQVSPHSAGSCSKLVFSWRFLRLAVGAYFLAALLLWGTLFGIWLRGTDARPSDSIGPDFPAFYTGGWMLRHGETPLLYNFERQHQIQQQLNLNARPDDLSAWVHPPHYAFVMVPFSALPPRTAYILYALSMWLCFAAGLAILRRLLPGLQTPTGTLLIAMALVSPPVYFSLSAGQNTGLTFLLHCAILAALLKGQDWKAGALLAVGLLKPHLFLAVLIWLLCARRWRVLGGFVVGAILTIALCTQFFGNDVFLREWNSLQTPIYRSEEVAQAFIMNSWQSFWQLLFEANSLTSLLGWVCALAVLVIMCVVWNRLAKDKNNATPDRLLMLYAASICAVVVTTPHLPVYDLGLLILPVLVFTNRVLDYSPGEAVVLRWTLLILVVFACMGESWARMTHLQIVVPLVTLLIWVSLTQFKSSSLQASPTLPTP
jgi:hypothetical protein